MGKKNPQHLLRILLIKADKVYVNLNSYSPLTTLLV